MNTATAEFLEGATVYTRDDEKVGSVSEVWTDADGRPTHVEVTSGWFGTDKHIIPLSKLARRGDEYVAVQSKKELEEALAIAGRTYSTTGASVRSGSTTVSTCVSGTPSTITTSPRGRPRRHVRRCTTTTTGRGAA